MLTCTSELHIDATGNGLWRCNGKIHRTDGPAFVGVDGTEVWYFDDQYLGHGDAGFWALWDLLTPDQRNNLNLLMYLPKI